MTPPAPAPSASSFWREGTAALLARLGAKPDGLTSDEARDRLRVYGPNSATVARKPGLVLKFLRRLTDPLVAILLVAAALSGVMGDWQSFSIIVVLVMGSILLDLIQEAQADHAVERLQSTVAVRASALRDGKPVETMVRDLVPGDVVVLSGGDLVPADGIVLESHDALADEAVLTGEPFPVEKNAAPSVPSPQERPGCALFSGTSLVAGTARMLVVATGAKTRLGAISSAMQAREPPTAFERGIRSLGMLILRLTAFLTLFVLLTEMVRHKLSFQTFLFAVALAVGLTPELLPMIMTVTLARGATRMAERKVIVRRLTAIHDLGAMDVLCSDKTGTLTEARIEHTGSFGPSGAPDERVTTLARLNARFCDGLRNNLDVALLGKDAPPDDGWNALDDLPFDFTRRRSTVLVQRGETREIIVKGAPEALLALCDSVAGPDGTATPLDEAKRREILAFIGAKGAEGLRLLGVASRPAGPGTTRLTLADETGLTFAGCAAFIDPPKASAAPAVRDLAAAGVKVKVISGDSPAVVQHLMKTLALPAAGIMTGEEIDALSDIALRTRVETTDLFARVAPEQKARIVLALRRAGHTVGYMGDGINDAPAIHAADVGLSVAGGTEVAREAAAIVLLQPDLDVLLHGVHEGRRTYANIMKYVRMGTSSNFGNMLSMAVASVALPFLPLTPVQILLNNILYDLSEIGIPFDTADPADLDRPHRWDMGMVLRFTLVMGPLSSIFDALTFAALLGLFHTPAGAFRTGWFVESIVTQILVIFLIRTAGPFWRSRPDRKLTVTSFGALFAALLLALTPLGTVFGFTALPPGVLPVILLIALAYLVLAELLKPLAMKARK